MKNTLSTLLLMAVSTWVLAGPGHDHGSEETPSAAGAASPRVVMESDLFDAVGVLKNGKFEIFVDHASTNAPVQNAILDLELNGNKVAVEQHDEGQFDAVLPDSIGEENVSIALTITAGDNIDMLAGDLNLAHPHPEEHTQGREYFSTTLLFCAAIVLLLALVTWLVKRRTRITTSSGLSVLALSGIVLLTSNTTYTWAGPGHDHGDEATAPALGDSPRRQPSGEVFLPKPAQRQLTVRTMPAEIKPHAKVVELNGKVALDPQTGGLVQTALGGRFEPAPQGVPQLGQSVKKGELLGYVVANQNPLERSGQQAQLAQLKSQLALAQSRLQRVQQLQDTLPKKELDAALSDVQSLKGQVSALSGGISAKEALRAPTHGVIASSVAVSGKVFDAGTLVFEVSNPSVVRIDATWFDGSTVPHFSGAKVAYGNSGTRTIALRYLGAAGAVRDQSLILAFENRDLKGIRFATGQLLKVYAEQTEKTEGIAIPSTALVKNASNQTIVWVKTKPETFEPRTVITESLDGQSMLIKSGLNAGDRVVTQGATLINQVR